MTKLPSRSVVDLQPWSLRCGGPLLAASASSSSGGMRLFATDNRNAPLKIKAISFPSTQEQENVQTVFRQFAGKSFLSPHTSLKPGELQRYYVPFWLFELHVRVVFVGRLGTKIHRRVGKEVIEQIRWTRTPPLTFDHQFDNVYCYASTVFERKMVEKAVASGMKVPASELERMCDQIPLKSNDYEVDVYTLDSDSAWDLSRYRTIEPQLKELAKNILWNHYPGYDQYEIESMNLQFLGKITNELVYYPIYVHTYPFLNLFWRSEQLRAFADALHLSPQNVTGYRHYGFIRTFGLSLFAGSVSYTLFDFGVDLAHFYPIVVAISGVVGMLALYSPIILKYFHHFDRERVNRFMASAQMNRDYKRTEGGRYYEYAEQEQQQSYYDYNRSRQQQRQQSQGYSSYQAGGIETEIKQGKDFYTILGLDPKKRDSYTDAQIQKAYRTAALKYHPDMHPDPAKKKQMEEKFKEVNQAYIILQDTTSRRQYNTYGKR